MKRLNRAHYCDRCKNTGIIRVFKEDYQHKNTQGQINTISLTRKLVTEICPCTIEFPENLNLDKITKIN